MNVSVYPVQTVVCVMTYQAWKLQNAYAGCFIKQLR
ncbi:hypothetical protein ANCDUO_16679 [Ancylostoma duodenale]|uniref:Uncharacterized protein n=1 Tax=Ancylostoma duodenale TaxID=51022 RepID=A0A0C2G838_9BILA|nr:hypothetical protein ANCDUO_16679 [Ancylostoma duodenale]